MADEMTALEARWLQHYFALLGEGIENATEAARRAGCKCKTEAGFKRRGHQLKQKLFEHIKKWKLENGLSEDALKLKLIELLNAKETKFFQKDGEVKGQVDVEALGVQIKALDMAMKVKGMYAPEKKKVSFEDDEGKQAVVGFFAKVMGVEDDPSGD